MSRARLKKREAYGARTGGGDYVEVPREFLAEVARRLEEVEKRLQGESHEPSADRD